MQNRQPHRSRPLPKGGPETPLTDDLIPEAKHFPAWKDVTLGSALNMATGVGNGAGKPEANIGDEPYDDSYMAFYNDGDFGSKLDKALARPRSYGWGVDRFVRYRDEDYFVLVAALDSLLKQKEGADKDIVSMLRREVYEKSGSTTCL